LFGADDSLFVAPEFDDSLLVRSNFVSGSAAFRRALFDKVGGYSPACETVGFEDYDFWIGAVERGARGGKVHGCHYEWRRHPGGSRNTVTFRDRLRLRALLARRHPRFFAHPRTARWLIRSARGRSTS
jgi:hypothetical protein